MNVAFLHRRLLLNYLNNCRSTQCILNQQLSSKSLDVKNQVKTSSIGSSVDDSILDNKAISIPSPFENFINSLVPDKLKPYSKLMRLEKPTGTLLLLYPSFWGIAMATPAGWVPQMSTLATFTAGAMLMRGAGCTINDMWDRKYDSQVERTKNRPLASGLLTNQDALFLLAGQLGASALILSTFDINSIAIGASSLLLVTFYPLSKRVTHWAQLVLGATFNWGVLLGYSVASHGTFDPAIVLPTYVAGICWTIIYDTIYAHQDKSDDLMIGLKSTAIKFGDDTAKWLSVFSSLMVGSLLISGVAADQTWPYYTSVVFVAGHLARQIKLLDIKKPQVCWKLFCSNWQIGLAIFLGISIGTLFKTKKDHRIKEKEC